MLGEDTMSNANVMTQHDSVVHFTKLVLGDRFQEGVDVKSYATKADQQEVSHLVTGSMLEGGTFVSDEAKAKYGADLRSKYVMGMIKNWWNRSKLLYGNNPYEVKNPGSRTGQGNEKIRTLRAMLVKLEGNAEATARIQAVLDTELAELAASKTKVITIDESLVPDELKDLIAS
jgi:hypothetical protein